MLVPVTVHAQCALSALLISYGQIGYGSNSTEAGWKVNVS